MKLFQKLAKAASLFVLLLVLSFSVVAPALAQNSIGTEDNSGSGDTVQNIQGNNNRNQSGDLYSNPRY